jgi:hypothetical protein
VHFEIRLFSQKVREEERSIQAAHILILDEFSVDSYSCIEILARRAMSARVQRATMIQEAIRILKNSSMCVPMGHCPMGENK